MDISIEEINDEITKYEEKSRIERDDEGHKGNCNFALEDEQKKGIINSLTNKFSIITGPPGTGKTVIIKCILSILYNLYKKYKKKYPNNEIKQPSSVVNPETIALLAPTGLAFINMKRDQSYYNEQISGTCHRVLYNTFENIKSHKYECKCDGPCKWDFNINLVIVDETSMIDIPLFHELLKLCEHFGSRLIMLGDVKQLPSIGPGIVLKSLIQSNCFDVTALKTIRRQKAGALLNNIIKMNEDIILKLLDFTDPNMELIDITKFVQSDIQIDKEAIITLIKKYILLKENTKFITYYKDDKYIFNVNSLNNILQYIFNPTGNKIPSNNKYDNKYIFCVHDRIVRTENDYSSETMRANGEDALIIGFDNRKVYIEYTNDKIKEEMSVTDLYENFALNYAVNIHKSQGSQYDTVVLFIEPESYHIDKTALYTAISRARYTCKVVSDINAFQMCQKNTKNDENKVSLFMRESDTYEL